MNGRWIIVLIMVFGFGSLKAQEHFYPSHFRNDAALYEGPVYGVKAGINFPRLYYTNSYLNDLQRNNIISPSASIFWEQPFLIPCTFAFELNYQERGGSFTYSKSGVAETYQLQAQYVSLRVPVSFYLHLSDYVKPYVFVAPDAGCVIGGDISLIHPSGMNDLSVDINPSNINYGYFGALGGLGIRFNIPFSNITLVLKADVAVNYGLTDTFSKHEHSGTAHPINGVNSYCIDGKRFSRGLECHLSLGFFINQYDACGWFP